MSRLFQTNAGTKKPIMIEIKPGKINANCQFSSSVKVPATNAPDPIPTPPNIPFIPSALPCLFAELITQGIPTGWYIEQNSPNKDKEINRLLGKDPLQGLSKLGLSADWAVNVISQVGNYAESFERNLYPLTIVRGMNALYKDGGLHYIPPIK